MMKRMATVAEDLFSLKKTEGMKQLNTKVSL